MESEYDGVVYDLDGTLVSLAVDWDAVRDDVVSVYESAGVDSEGDLWSLFSAAGQHGLRTEVEEAIATHEQAGARQSERLALATRCVSTTQPTAVCSLNCESACRIALDTHDLTDAVDTVVGRDTVSVHKPAPEPLEHALSDMGVAPADAVFIGDSERDAVTAERAGVAFRYADELTGQDEQN